MTINDQLDEFLASRKSNSWLRTKELGVYVRKGQRLIDGVYTNTLDIANIQQSDQFIGQGHFKSFMLYAESKGEPIFVECIHNPKLVTMLEKNGYTIIHKDHATHALKVYNHG